MTTRTLPAAPSTNAVRPELSDRLSRVHASRERLQATLGEIKAETEEKLAWRHWIRRRPLTSIGVAAGAGLLLGGLFGGRRRRQRGSGRGPDGRAVAGAAVSGGLSALFGSILVTRLGPVLIEHGVDFLVGMLERRSQSRQAATGVDAVSEPDPTDR